MLQGIVGHVPGDGGGQAAEGAVCFNHDDALRHAEAQTAHVFQRSDRVLGIGNVAEAAIRPGENPQTGLFGIGIEQFRRLAGSAAHHVVKREEKIGKREHPERLDHGDKVADAAKSHVKFARLHAMELEGLVFAQTPAVGEFHLDSVVAGFFDKFFEIVPQNAHFGTFRVAKDHVQDERGLFSGSCRRGRFLRHGRSGIRGPGGGSQEQQAKRQRKNCFAKHVYLFAVCMNGAGASLLQDAPVPHETAGGAFCSAGRGLYG